MMREKDGIILQEFAERVRRVFPEARIWAFGSRARGEAYPDSDFDICVVLKEADVGVRRQVQTIAWEVGLEQDIVLTVLCYAEAEFVYGPRTASPLVKSIIAEGIAA